MLIDLAERRDGGFVSLKEVAERQGISKKYSEQIITLLSRSDLLTANRGFQGGYKLKKEPSEISIGEILCITEGSLAPVGCLDGDSSECARRGECPTLPIWQGLNEVIHDYLYGITLQNVLDRNKERSF